MIRAFRPEVLPEFVRTLEPLRTRPEFTVLTLQEVFDPDATRSLEALLREIKASDLKMHELKSFGRFIVHDHPLLTELQSSIVDVASKAAGEPLEPRYNFLSLYTDLGVCPVHMDAPLAKWTLDLCIRQSQPWPIHVSKIVPWPEGFAHEGGDWDRAIRDDPTYRFEAHSLEPGQAIFFSGSSQWHYRDAHPGKSNGDYCDLAFFHFIPRGMGDTIEPQNWARLFNLPELTDIHKRS